MKTCDICIVGGGLSGLSSAAFILKENPKTQILVLEKGSKPGGVIRSFKEKGFLAEWGPHGFLDNCEASKSLLGWAGLNGQTDMAPLSRFVRYICLDGKLQEIPQRPQTIIRRPLISLPAKLRVVGDLWKKPLDAEPSVAQWVEHRFGAALLPFADAVFTGTYAGDINRLKIDAVMPGIRMLEKQHGSVIRGLVRSMLKKRKESCAHRKMPAMTSFVGGMEQLPLALAEKVGKQAEILCDIQVAALERSGQGWLVHYGDTVCQTKHLLLALPVNRCLELLGKVEGLPSPPVRKLPEARLASVLLGFDQSAEIPFGFGYLAPEKEERFALGALFSSHMFPGRAPENCQLVEVMIGGRRHDERLALDDSTMVNAAYQDLKELIPLPRAPIYSKVLRPAGGFPQLEDGYTELLGWRNRLMQNDPSLSICGFGWKGIGINDMTKEAQALADGIAKRQFNTGEVAVKAVYF